MTDEGVGGEQEDEEGDEQVHGEQGERRRGLLRVEDALEAEEAEGLLGAGIRLKVRGRGETHSEEHRGVQLDQRCQCRQEDSKVVARGERLQQEDERDHGERGVDGDGEEGEQRHADQVVEHAVDGLQCSEGGGVQRVALDALVGEADHGLHVVARVELGVSVAAHRNEGVGIQRAEQQELDVLVVRVGRAEAVAEEREQPARGRDAVGDVHRGEEAVKLEEEEVGEGDQPP